MLRATNDFFGGPSELFVLRRTMRFATFQTPQPMTAFRRLTTLTPEGGSTLTSLSWPRARACARVTAGLPWRWVRALTDARRKGFWSVPPACGRKTTGVAAWGDALATTAACDTVGERCSTFLTPS